MHHLVERGRDQARKADDVCADLVCRLEHLVRGHHHAEVDDVVVVAPEDDPDDVLPDVVDIALDRGEDDDASRPALPRLAALRFHERLEVGDCALHRARALHHLRQEHPSGAEEVADDLHAVHERALDHVERPVDTLTRLLDVLLDVVDDPVHERVLEPLLDRLFPPGEVDLTLRRTSLHALGVLEQTFRGIGPAIEDEILDELEQLGGMSS